MALIVEAHNAADRGKVGGLTLCDNTQRGMKKEKDAMAPWRRMFW